MEESQSHLEPVSLCGEEVYHFAAQRIAGIVIHR